MMSKEITITVDELKDKLDEAIKPLIEQIKTIRGTVIGSTPVEPVKPWIRIDDGTIVIHGRRVVITDKTDWADLFEILDNGLTTNPISRKPGIDGMAEYSLLEGWIVVRIGLTEYTVSMG